jgi:hypothetical protein
MPLKNGARFPVRHEDVFADGLLFVPGSIGPVEDYNEVTKARTPSFDKVTGERVWQVRGLDLSPELGTRSREVAIKILADVQPVPPSNEVCPIELVGLTVTPYVNDKGRLAFSFRASGVRAPSAGTVTRSRTAGGDDKAA